MNRRAVERSEICLITILRIIISNDIDLFALHYVYILRINAHLEIFREAYSRHRLRTEGHGSPLQLWIRGMLATSDHTAASGVYDNENLTDVT